MANEKLTRYATISPVHELPVTAAHPFSRKKNLEKALPTEPRKISEVKRPTNKYDAYCIRAIKPGERTESLSSAIFSVALDNLNKKKAKPFPFYCLKSFYLSTVSCLHEGLKNLKKK